MCLIYLSTKCLGNQKLICTWVGSSAACFLKGLKTVGGIFHHFTQELVKHLWQSMVDGKTGDGIMCTKFQRTCSSLMRFEIPILLFLFHPKMLLGYNIASFSPLEPWNFPIFFHRKLCHHGSHCT